MSTETPAPITAAARAAEILAEITAAADTLKAARAARAAAIRAARALPAEQRPSWAEIGRAAGVTGRGARAIAERADTPAD